MKHTLLIAALAWSAPAIAEQRQPQALIEDATAQAITYLEDGSLAPGEAEALLSYVDVDAVARFALGRYVHQADERTYSRYRLAMERHLIGQLQTHLAQLSDGDVEIKDTVPRGEDQAIVQTEVTPTDGESMDVDWRMRREDGGWSIIDIEAMGLWLAIEQRAQFSASLDQSDGNIDALIAELEATR